MNNMKIMEDVVKKGKGLKQAINIKQIGKQQIQALKDKNNKTATCRDTLLKIAAKYYEDLYVCKLIIPQKGTPLDTCEISEITIEEVVFALNSMKLGKAPGK